MKHIALALAAAVAVLTTTTASADQYLVEYTGDLTILQDAGGDLAGATTFSASFRYDTETPDVEPYSRIGIYALADVVIRVGDHEVLPIDPVLSVGNNIGLAHQDEYFVESTPGVNDDGYTIQFCAMRLTDLSGTAWQDDFMPDPPVDDLTPFALRQFFLDMIVAGGSFVVRTEGTIAGVSVTPLNACPADLSPDGVIDSQDLAVLLAGWGASGVGDLDASGAVDAGDLAILLAAWGPC